MEETKNTYLCPECGRELGRGERCGVCSQIAVQTPMFENKKQPMNDYIAQLRGEAK